MVQVYELVLQSDGSPSKELGYVRLPPPDTQDPYVLRISIEAGSIASKQGELLTSYPIDGSPYERSKFHKLPLSSDLSKSIEMDIKIVKAGVFEFYVEYENDSGQRVEAKHVYFNVDPIIRGPARSSILDSSHQLVPSGGAILDSHVTLPLDGLVIQTVIAKWMGNITQWHPHLHVTSQRGYNMLHFTPLQQRGVSNSPYSLFDQLEFADDLFDKKLSQSEKIDTIKKTLADIKKTYGLLSMTDVVYNHTANNSDWLLDHPEAGYNVQNSPHLEGALVLDRALFKFSTELAKYGLPDEVKTEQDVARLIDVLEHTLLPSLELWQFYVIDVASTKKQFAEAWSAGTTTFALDSTLRSLGRAELLQSFASSCLPKDWNLVASRFHAQFNVPSAVRFVASLIAQTPSIQTVDAASASLESILNDLNLPQYKMYDSDIQSIIDNCQSRIKWQRLDPNGPLLGKFDATNPIVDRYFTELPDNERTKKHDRKAMALANNGWIWNADPLQDFASNTSRAYIRREVIAWGDCVKLRYGASEEDSPALWKRMYAYTELMAELFDGFRIDNCHSTPIHVGEKMLDAARRVNHNLYVCAELFTGSEDTDTYFVKRLGINSLIREALNGNDPKDESRLLYNYGIHKPIGSMDGDCLTETNTIVLDGKTQNCTITPLTGSKPHALFMDCTHDNEAPNHKRTPQDAMATGALVPMCYSAVGSNKGFDDFYGKLINVVTETRQYEIYEDAQTNLGLLKRVVNHLHTEMALDGYVEGYVHQENDYIFMHRVHPATQRGYLLVAHTCFHDGVKGRGDISPIRLRGQHATRILSQKVDIHSRSDPADPNVMKGLPNTVTELEPIQVATLTDNEGSYSEICIPDEFPPGSVALFATWAEHATAELDAFCTAHIEEAFSKLDLVDLNIVLYRADAEERDFTCGQDGTYNVPGLGQLVYCGLEGWMPSLRHIMRYNDLGHPLCAHLRAGTWAFDYVFNRHTSSFPNLEEVAQWFKARFDKIALHVPAFLRPKYFAMIVNAAYKAARDRALSVCSPFVRDGHRFTHALTLVAVQMYGQVKSASITPFEERPVLAAGLPHFTTGWARSWGRDVAISLKGLLMVTGQFDAAREHILAFASTLKHGLIPNLLDSIKTPRYNCRDAPWFFLQNIQDYVELAPEGLQLLSVSVKRRFPKDDHWVPFDSPEAYAYSSTVAEVIHEILQRHANGIHFREYNAGPNLDSQMRDEGFNIDIDVDWSTGLVKGGNPFNCGTWMDKMGESEKAGTKGLPGTSRDGAPVECTGLLKSALRWISALNKKDAFPFQGVDVKQQDGTIRFVSFQEWNDLLQASFEKEYYVPLDPADDKNYAVEPRCIARRGIYKDVVGTKAVFSDYQLRANFPIAMAVAPELFDPQHALQAMQTYIDVLWGPLGVRTLDPTDFQYRPYYDNANDSDDPAVAKGRNYHQGPEWGWPAGYLLRAYFYFDSKYGQGTKNIDYTIHRMHTLLSERKQHIEQDPWAGLPELTNKDGAFCYDSCTTQAWSASTILDALYDIYTIKQSSS